MKNRDKNSLGQQSRRGWRGWSPVRRILAVSYGLILMGAVAGIVYFSGQPPLPPPVARLMSGAVVKALAVPFAPVTLKAAPPPNRPQAMQTPQESWKSTMRVAIVIDDIGPDIAGARRAIQLDANVTLSLLPYAKNIRALAALARTSGHELLLHLPMEPLSHKMNPGPHALLTTLAPLELLTRLDWNLGRFDGYVGINNHMGSHFTTNAGGMIPVMEALKVRGLLFLDSRTTDATVGRSIALQVGIPFAERDVFLDNEVSPGAVEVQLDRVIAIAHKHGSAIAIGHPHEVTLKKLEAWIPTLERQGIALVPLSQLVTRPLAVAKVE